MEKQMIEEKAMEVLNKGNDKGDSAINIIGIATSLGFVVGNVDLSEGEDGFILVDEKQEEILGQDTNKLIGVNADLSEEWKRFIIAHEIVHFILHYNKSENKGLYAHREHRKGKDSIENEADYFAASLLMPADRFKKNYNELKKANLSLEEMIFILAKRFRVTQIMAKRRIEELQVNA